tara:strand:- start:594 stop:740 length:147 start_codon:yes stop_codon:yes gene_type:complete
MSLKRKIQTLKIWIKRSPAGQSKLDREFQSYKTELKETKANNIKNYQY